MGIFDFRGKDSLNSVIAKYEKLSSEKPENASLKNTLGDLYFKKGITDKALKCYQETVALLLKNRQNEKALAIVKKSIAYDIFDIKSIEEVANNLLSKGMKKDAINIYVQLAKKKLNTNRTTANDIFRKILEFDSNNEEALAFFKKGKQSSMGVSEDENILKAQATSSVEAASLKPESESLNIIEHIDANQDFKELDLDDEDEEAQKIAGKLTEKPLPFSSNIKSEGTVADNLKDKFLTVAKEKNYLETIIIQQNDIIVKLEKDKNHFSHMLNHLEEENKMIKARLLDIDTLHEEEISELKKKIENLSDENKKLLAGKEIALQNSDLKQEDTLLENAWMIESLTKENLELKSLLSKTDEEFRNKSANISDFTGEQEKALTHHSQLTEENEERKSALISLQGKIDELQKIIGVKENEISETKNDLFNTTTIIGHIEAELASAQVRNKEIEKEKDALKAKIDVITDQVSNLSQEKTNIEEELNQKIMSCQAEINKLEDNIDKLTKLSEEKVSENELNEKISFLHDELTRKDELLAERSEACKELKAKIIQIEGASNQLEEEMKKLIYEKEQDINILSIEKEDLLKKVVDLKTELDKLQNEENNDASVIKEELNSALRKITGLETSLENSLNENSELRNKLQKITESVNEKTQEVSVPSEIMNDIKSDSIPEFGDKIIFRKKKHWLPYVLFSAAIIVIVVGLSVFSYKLFSYLSSKKSLQNTTDLPVAEENLNYNDIFNRMTRVEASKNTKFQATIITESLLRKENAGKTPSKFDFKNFIYLKININSLKARLSLDFIKNPALSLKLNAGTATALPAEGSRIEGLKTFYRGKAPVSMTFLYVYPKKKVSPDLKQLQLLMNDNGSEIRLTWDAQMLKSSKVIP